MTTAGEGGMVNTSRPELWDVMWSFKDHGKTHEAVFGCEHPPGFRWLHERFGSNFRLTELQSAIGRIQLQRLPEWTAIRVLNALSLAEALSDYCRACSLATEHPIRCWYKFYAFVQPEALLAEQDVIWRSFTRLSCILGKVVRFIWRSAGCWPVYERHLWPVSSVKPALCFWCIRPLLLSRWLAMPKPSVQWCTSPPMKMRFASAWAARPLTGLTTVMRRSSHGR